jgi:ribosomal protein S18 acetylase RimI-like enzyme
VSGAGLRPSVPVEIRREDHHSLAEYAAIPIAFEVREALRTPSLGTQDSPLPRRLVPHVYRKDYDAVPGNHPRDWPRRFAVERADFIAAYLADRRVGGAVLVVDPTDVDRLGGERECALLWDLRVAPDVRGRGIGRALLAAVEMDARRSGAHAIAVETQDINIAACLFYADAGFRITRIQPDAYPDLPGETLIVWTKIWPSAPRS